MGAAGGDPLGTCAVAITAGPQSESIDGAWTMEGDVISAVFTVESEEVTWNLTYEGDQLTMDQNGQFETFHREEDEDAIVPVTFADGAYTYSAESEKAEVGSLTAQMLKDGSLQLTMTAGETASTLILTPVEAE